MPLITKSHSTGSTIEGMPDMMMGEATVDEELANDTHRGDTNVSDNHVAEVTSTL